MLLSSLCNNRLWLYGPDFINNCYASLPKFEFTTNIVTESATYIAVGDQKIAKIYNLDDLISRCSNYSKLIRVTAYVLRFISNLKASVQGQSTYLGFITSTEISSAEHLWYLNVQSEIKNNNYKQLARDLQFFKNDDVIRCRGRMKNAPLHYDAKYPIFIPRNTKFATLLIQHYHALVLHSGLKDTINSLRSKYWIPKARNLIRKTIRSCIICIKIDRPPMSYPVAPPLPASRLKDTHPFDYTGIDYFGPVYVSDICSSDQFKSWVFLFTCASTRCLCLELVPDCSASSCIKGLQRFFGRRGVPSHIISDNGSQFIAKITQEFATLNNIKWSFNVPAAPWWGGMFERLVRMSKRCLKKVLGKNSLNYEEFSTLLIKVENVINNRPLTFCYDTPSEFPITPNHLLYGRTLNFESHRNMYNPEFEYNIDINARFKHLNKIFQNYWQRWKVEYVTELREHHKVKSRSKDTILKVNDVVIITEDKTPRTLWRVGIITNINKSSDKKIRAVQVRCVTPEGHISLITRPINKLVLLEATKSSDTDQSIITPTFIDTNNVQMITNVSST